MRAVRVLFVFLAAVFSGCTAIPQQKAITIANAGAVDAAALENIRAFAQAQLRVPVRVADSLKLAERKRFQDLEADTGRMKTDADVILIVLAAIRDHEEPLTVFPDKGIALVNVTPLVVEDEKKFNRRVERMVMRAAAFAFGLESTPDPFCVTRDYSSLDDLDRMGRNYSPPWQGRFAEEAANRGLVAPEPKMIRK